MLALVWETQVLNQSIIFATARDTNVGAKSANGSTWSESNVSASEKYGPFGGDSTKFLYGVIDNLRKFSTKVFGITDNTLWRSGILPTQQSEECIVLVSDELTRLYYSYDGVYFITGAESV
jgi:hypothetical protein